LPATIATQISHALIYFVLGLAFSVLAFFIAYFTQLRLFNESLRPTQYKPGCHTISIWGTAVAAALSLAFFIFGAVSGIGALTGS
jgi:hypothetical protein